jgi:LacI family transcriptional regulator
MSAMITINEIARLAGVSPTTVSNVLHGRTAKMAPETLERVRRLIKENNYVSNMSGRTLGRYGSKIIGVIRNYERRDEINAIQDPFFSEIIGALEHEIRHRGYFMMLYISADVEESLRMARSWNVEGLITIGGNADDCHQFMLNTTIPLVFIDAYFHDDGIPYVNTGLQDRLGAYMMTEYLIKQGHKRIAFLADAQEPEGVDYERLRGCQEAMENQGLPFLPEDYRYVSYRLRERHEILKAFIRQDLGAYSALFFASDYLAADSINLFHDEGVRVPDDISVCGFDDNIFALGVRPKLTTVAQDVSKKASCAAGQVFRLIDKEPITARQIHLPVALKIRDSVAKK